MRAIAFAGFGGAEVLRMNDLPVPLPGPEEVQMKIEYTSVNPVDWKIREGHMKDFIPHRFPIIPGWDAAGMITALGAGSSLYKVGDKVFAYCRKPIIQEGTYAEFITLKQENVALFPGNLGFRDAACVPLAGLTAWQALFDHAKIRKGESILIHAGAGGVGGFAIQMAKASGLRILTTASLRNHELVQSYGADIAIDYVREDIAAICQKECDGVDVVLDLMGGDTQQKSFAALKKGGRMICAVDTPNAETAKMHGIKIHSFLVEPSGPQLTEIGQWLTAEKIRIPPLREYDLKDAAAAQSLSQTGHVQGKIVLKVK